MKYIASYRTLFSLFLRSWPRLAAYRLSHQTWCTDCYFYHALILCHAVRRSAPISDYEALAVSRPKLAGLAL